MQAFTDTVITKDEMVKELKRHQELDSFITGNYGQYSEGGTTFKGCAVGCSLESISRVKGLGLRTFNDHAQYETLMGIPEWLARVEDTIFEGVSKERSKLWPVEFIEAVNVGADLEKIKAPFLIYVLESNLERLKDDKFKEQRDAVLGSIALWKRDDIGSEDWQSARSAAARSAASAASAASARSAAEWAAASAASAASARSAAEWAAAEWAARSAAEWAAAEWAAARSARSAASAAEWAARSAAARSAARSARSAASAAYEKFANKLIELIKECI